MRYLVIVVALGITACSEHGYDLDVRDSKGAFVHSDTFASKERCEMHGKQRVIQYDEPNPYDQFDPPEKRKPQERHSYVCTKRTAR